MKALSILVALAAGLATAQGPILTGPSLSLTATTENVAGAPDSIRIDLLRWSTDAERDQLVSAWSMTRAAGRGGSAGVGSGAVGRGAAGRGGRGGGGGAAAADPASDEDFLGDPSALPVARPGRGRGGGGEQAPPPTAEGTLAAALQRASTVGYLWSSEVAGYAVRYAGKVTRPDGIERIILITSRRLGATNDLWKPVVPGAPSTYDFSVIELRVNAKGEGEGKASLMGKVVPDPVAKIVTLEDYGSLPVVLKNVRPK
jgi:hypothetical protein